MPSRSDLGAYWHVTWHTSPNGGIWFNCGCPAGRERRDMAIEHSSPPCRHVRLVAVVEAADGYPPRPPAPTNVAAIVE